MSKVMIYVLPNVKQVNIEMVTYAMTVQLSVISVQILEMTNA